MSINATGSTLSKYCLEDRNNNISECLWCSSTRNSTCIVCMKGDDVSVIQNVRTAAQIVFHILKSQLQSVSCGCTRATLQKLNCRSSENVPQKGGRELKAIK